MKHSSLFLIGSLIVLSSCQGPYRVTPDAIRDQDAVHSTAADPRDRIDRVVLQSDRTIYFDNDGAYYEPASYLIHGKMADSESDTSIALNSVKAAYVIRQDATAQGAAGVGWVITGAFIGLMILAAIFAGALQGLSTI